MERGPVNRVRLPRFRSTRAKAQVLQSPSCGAVHEEAAAVLPLNLPSMPLHPQVARLRRIEPKRNRDAKKCRHRSQLEEEVRKLQVQLQEEIDLHVALADAIRLNASPSKFPLNLPDKARELVDNIITLETTVSELEQELSALHLSVARARYERELRESNHPGRNPGRDSFSGHSWEEQISSLRSSKRTPVPLNPDKPSASSREDDEEQEEEEASWSHSTECDDQETDAHHEARRQLEATESLKRTASPFPGRNLWHDPNKLSEEMVRCMRSIFLCLSESHQKSSSESLIAAENSSVLTSALRGVVSEEGGELSDPYGVHGKALCSSVGGAYSSAVEVSWMVVGQDQLEYAAETLRIFRFLVEQLAKVSPGKMIGDQRLSFWINLYNALVMHAYLAYGVPRNDAKHLSLMQKVSYNVAGQSISAADMEYDILKMKPAAYRPHVVSVFSAQKFAAVSQVQSMLAIDCSEPLAMFGLSSGMFSSPAVRIFSESGVKEELQIALRDYVRASVGIGLKGKLLVPKIVYCYAKAVGIEDSLLVDWICRFLSPEQASEVRNSASPRKQRLLGARSFIVIPFDSRFRYLFLTEEGKA